MGVGVGDSVGEVGYTFALRMFFLLPIIALVPNFLMVPVAPLKIL